MLHILNQSPLTSNALKSCLRVIQTNDVILLIEDAVLAALINNEIHAEIAATLKQHVIYALKPDIAARGIIKNIIPGIKLITFEEFVELTIQYHPIQNWT